MFTAKQVIHHAIEAGLIDGYASEYAEPGYSLGGGKHHILFADWNPKSFEKNAHKDLRVMSRLADVAERAGCEVEWSDEWSTCDECGGAVRTSPDRYSWQPSYAIDEGGVTCENCIDPATCLEGLEGVSSNACTFDIDPADHGYVAVKREMENGLHPGQVENPSAVARSLDAMGVDRYLFTLDSTGQFDIEFSVWVHESEVEKITGEILSI